MMSNFPSHWQLLPLEEVMETIIDYRGKTPKKTDFGIPLITAKIVKGGRILEPAEFIAEEDYDSWMVRGLPIVGDVVVTSEAPLGEVAQLTDQNVALAQRIVTLRGKEHVLNNDFLLCVMQSSYVQNQLDARASGSTVKGIKQSELRKILLPIPPENEQKKIAQHIKTLTEKIELNRQTNQTLEHIAQAMFKSWFIDFEPTRAKIAAKQEWAQKQLAGNNGENDTALFANITEADFIERAAIAAISGKPVTELDQLPLATQTQLKATAALFPNALVDSELGMIPEGWGTETLEDIIELSYGKALKKTDRIAGEFPVYGSGGLTGTHDKALVEGPGVIVGRKGTVGALYWEDDSFFPIDTVFYVKCKGDITLVYAYYLLQTLGLENMNTDAAVPGLNRNNAYRLDIVKPSVDLVISFSSLIDGFRNKLLINKQETISLENIRYTLLPKLLSGELSINPHQKVNT